MVDVCTLIFLIILGVCRIWSVQYNMFHDQLLLTASSDSQVVLARLPSIASEPLRHIDVDEGEEERWGHVHMLRGLAKLLYLPPAPLPPRQMR